MPSRRDMKEVKKKTDQKGQSLVELDNDYEEEASKGDVGEVTIVSE
jgi:hypothetical protein